MSIRFIGRPWIAIATGAALVLVAGTARASKRPHCWTGRYQAEPVVYSQGCLAMYESYASHPTVELINQCGSAVSVWLRDFPEPMVLPVGRRGRVEFLVPTGDRDEVLLDWASDDASGVLTV